MNRSKDIRTVRRLLAIFIVSLFISGLTVLPVAAELRLARSVISNGSAPDQWLARVQLAYSEVNSRGPFLLYGYDWLAFAHFVLAGLFIGPWLHPVRNRWVIQFGLGACILILPFAFIAGYVRGIPFWWQLIDCSFGIIGFAVLWPCHRLIQSRLRHAIRAKKIDPPLSISSF